MRFERPRSIRFGASPSADTEDDDSTGLPTPRQIRLRKIRAAGLREARDVVAVLPEPGECTSCLVTHRMDLVDIITFILDRLGPCDRADVASLGFNARTFRVLLRWLDQRRISSLSLVASLFFKSHNGQLAETARVELAKRGHRFATGPCHAKAIALHFANGTKLSLFGSGNLCSSGSSLELIAIVNDAELCDWHSSWITGLVAKYGG
jgi:hypothetical protein